MDLQVTPNPPAERSQLIRAQVGNDMVATRWGEWEWWKGFGYGGGPGEWGGRARMVVGVGPGWFLWVVGGVRGGGGFWGVLFRTIFFFFQAEDGIRDLTVTGVQTCALPI